MSTTLLTKKLLLDVEVEATEVLTGSTGVDVDSTLVAIDNYENWFYRLDQVLGTGPLTKLECITQDSLGADVVVKTFTAALPATTTTLVFMEVTAIEVRKAIADAGLLMDSTQEVQCRTRAATGNNYDCTMVKGFPKVASETLMNVEVTV